MTICKFLTGLSSDNPQQKKDEKDFSDNLSSRPSIFSSSQKLWPFVLPYWRTGFVAALALLFASLLALPQPLLTKYIFDEVILQKNITALAVIAGLLLLILLLENGLAFLKQFYFARFEQEVIFHMQQRLFQRILRFPKSFFDNKQTGTLMSRLLADVQRLRMLFSSTLVESATNILKFIGGIIILFFLHWQLTLFSLLFLPFFYASVHFLGGRTRQSSHNMMEKYAQVSRNLHESLSAVELIKAFATEEKESQKLTDTLEASVQANLERTTLLAFSQLVIGVIAGVGTLFVLWYGSREIILGRLTIGGFMAFNGYLAYLYGPTRYLSCSAEVS